jgi:phosphoribosylaminoimidazole carboxylase (NCAIR synthetase)
MNKSALLVALGAMMALSAQVTKDAFMPVAEPAKCEASQQAKDALASKQASIDALSDLLKKSGDNLTTLVGNVTASCAK